MLSVFTDQFIKFNIHACLLFKSILFWFDPKCWSSFFSQKVCYPIIKQMPKLRLRNDWSTRFASFSKKWAFTLVPPSCMTISRKKTHSKVFTNDAISITNTTQHVDDRQTAQFSSAAHFECQLLFQVVFVCAMNNGVSKRRVSCTSSVIVCRCCRINSYFSIY